MKVKQLELSGTMSASQAAKKWGISVRRVRYLCQHFKVYNARRLPNGEWSIPDWIQKPQDGRHYRYTKIPSNLREMVKRADEVLKRERAKNHSFDPEERWRYFLKGSAHHMHVVNFSLLRKRVIFDLVDGREHPEKPQTYVQAVKNHVLALNYMRSQVKLHRPISLKLVKQFWSILKFGDLKPHRTAYYDYTSLRQLKVVIRTARKRNIHPLIRAGDILNEFFLRSPFREHSARTGYIAANFILMCNGYPPVIINRIIFRTVIEYLDNYENMKAEEAKISPGLPSALYEPEIRHAFINTCVIHAIHYSARLHLPTFNN